MLPEQSARQIDSVISQVSAGPHWAHSVSRRYPPAQQVGAQLGLVSITGGYFKGAQLGWAFNYAKEVTGLQFGVVNYAERLNKGLQIGLVNIAANGFLPGFVILNFNFESGG